MIFAMSDIHGQYELFRNLMEQIPLGKDDTLYVLGDVVDRGPDSMNTLKYMMANPNIIPIMGNHELMALPCLKLLVPELSKEFLHKLSSQARQSFAEWTLNGGISTIQEFLKLPQEERRQVVEYIEAFRPYGKKIINNGEYWLIHAGLEHFSESRQLEEYSVEELVWKRTDFDIAYFKNITVVSGHTPTQNILGNSRPGYIFKKNNHIAIDCGAGGNNGRLAVICLDTGEEYYAE